MAGPSIRNPEQRGQAVLDLRGWCPTREPVGGARRADVAHPQAPCPGSVSATGTASADPAPGRRDRPVPADCPPRTWAPRSGPAPSPGTPRRPGHRTRAGGRRTCHSSSEDVPTTRPPALTVSGRPPVVSLGVAAVKAASSVDCPVPARRSAVQSARLSIRGATLARSPRSSTSSPGARRSGAVDSSSASSASLWAEPRCSTCSTCRPRRVTICAATAPDDVRILRTNRETTPEGFHAEVLSDHLGTPAVEKHQVRTLRFKIDQARGTSQGSRRCSQRPRRRRHEGTWPSPSRQPPYAPTPLDMRRNASRQTSSRRHARAIARPPRSRVACGGVTPPTEVSPRSGHALSRRVRCGPLSMRWTAPATVDGFAGRDPDRRSARHAR